MSKLSPEVLTKFGGLQDQIWQNVASTVAAYSDPAPIFSFEAPECNAPEALRALAGETLLNIQFAFASQPEHFHILIVPNELFSQLLYLVKGEELSQPDDSNVADIREFLEGFVQGICLACGIIKNEPMVASGLSIRCLPFVLPDNFSANEDSVRVQVSIAAPGVEGILSWYVDNATVSFLSGEEDEVVYELPQGEQDSASSTAFDSARAPEESGGLDILLDIPLEISVELGRVKMLVKEVVELGAGSIVEIDKAAGEPVDVMVNGRLVARGEVVVIEDNFGVRITEILTAQERITKLNEAA